ncbi:helix-turn-helix domain-containing protein [Aquirufa sp. KTFRIE-69F]|uniref:Helix-turn-helix domain-containing protein n=1 Tax=Aquirufa originis TaxID=3096514 RepID=A0ABW6D3N1_9BACT
MIDLLDFMDAGILCGLLTVYILLFKKNALRSYSDYLLSVSILCQIWAVSLFLFVFSGSIQQFPYLYRTAAPLTFLVPPLGYLYVRSVLYNEKKWQSLDFLHLLPFLFFIINYLPFFLSPLEYKVEIVTKTIQDKNFGIEKQLGFLPESVFYLFRPIQASLYLIFQWRLIVTFTRDNPDQTIKDQINRVTRWLSIFTWATSGFLIAFFIVLVLYFTQENLFTSTELTLIPNIILAISHFVVFTYLLINPQVLTGLPFIRYKETPSSLVDNETVKVPFILENYSKEIKKLEKYFQTQKTYLQPNLAISQVAVETQIPNRDLSYIINNYYQKRFNDYLNEMRLTHFLSQIDANTLDNLTIEAIAFDSGFSSKSSFYRAFNRFYGCTPSEYLETLKTPN